jgi:hypothetical protein
MELIPSLDEDNCSGTKIPSVLWNSEVHCHVHKSSILAPILRQMNLVFSISLPYLCKIHFSIILALASCVILGTTKTCCLRREWNPNFSLVQQVSHCVAWAIPVPIKGLMTPVACLHMSCHKNKLHGLSPRANYTDRATAACRPSDCHLLRIEGATWLAWRIPYAVFSDFWTGAATFLSSSSSVVPTRLSGPRSRPTTCFPFFLLFQKIW